MNSYILQNTTFEMAKGISLFKTDLFSVFDSTDEGLALGLKLADNQPPIRQPKLNAKQKAQADRAKKKAAAKAEAAKAQQKKNAESGSNSAPAPAAAALPETAEGLAIRQQVAEYGKQIAALKKEGKGKDVFMPVVQKMIALKNEYKKVTGKPFDPPKSKKKKGGKQNKQNKQAKQKPAPKKGKKTPAETLAEAESKYADAQAQVAAASGNKKALKKAQKNLKFCKKKLDAAKKACSGPAQKSEKALQRAQQKAQKAAQALADKEANAAWTNPTPWGEKPDTSKEIYKEYVPKRVEAAWGAWWEKEEIYSPDAAEALKKPASERFTIVIPPPNVTGSLHIGHALTCAIEDTIVRWHRMQGKSVLWVPGTDHAGIATQTQVEKLLMKESNLTRHDLGREAFLKKVWQWKHKKGGRITKQLRKLGSSVDWKREVFTMDANLNVAVREAFVRMYNDGSIYRAKRLVNWCSKLNTAISDIEVDTLDLKGRTMKNKIPGHDPKHQYEFGVLIKFAYKVEGCDEEVVVATTRLETMLGDTAVAVHPDDARYKHLHGKQLVHPFRSDDHEFKTIPLITDGELVDMAFGTGVVKVTPAHDQHDYECGLRNDLKMIDILDDNGSINANGAPFNGLMRFDARERILEKMKELKLYRGTEENPMQIPLCSRSKDIIEPRLKPQWYVNTEKMAGLACEAVEKGELKLIPEKQKATWFRWLGPENIRHWCISRQLWWGHRIPAYLVKVAGAGEPDSSDDANWVVARTEKEAMALAVKKKGVCADKITLKQDPDVLDTWFSSGLFPFSVMGWPNEESPDMKAFFPGSLLETGHDILFFWVARMVMMSLTLTGKLPFSEVYLHSMVRDKYGSKMSKSKGNVIDPIDVIEGATLKQLLDTLENSLLHPREVAKYGKTKRKDFPQGLPACGADALRFGLLCENKVAGSDVNLDINRVIGWRKFCNKLWNLHKLGVLWGLEDSAKFTPPKDIDALLGLQLSGPDKWILYRLSVISSQANQYMADYEIALACQLIYDFMLKEFAAYYAELCKVSIRSGDGPSKYAAQATFYTVLEAGYCLLHPMMPFVTEELWQRLPRSSRSAGAKSVSTAPYPNPAKSAQFGKLAGLEADAVAVNSVISVIETLNRQRGIFLTGSNAAKRPAIYLVTADSCNAKVLADNIAAVQSLCKTGKISVVDDAAKVPVGCNGDFAHDKYRTEVHMMLKGIVNFAQEIKKLQGKLGKLKSKAKTIEGQLADPKYNAKAGKEQLHQDQERLNQHKEEITAMETQITAFQKLV